MSQHAEELGANDPDHEKEELRMTAIKIARSMMTTLFPTLQVVDPKDKGISKDDDPSKYVKLELEDARRKLKASLVKIAHKAVILRGQLDVGRRPCRPSGQMLRRNQLIHVRIGWGGTSGLWMENTKQR